MPLSSCIVQHIPREIVEEIARVSRGISCIRFGQVDESECELAALDISFRGMQYHIQNIGSCPLRVTVQDRDVGLVPRGVLISGSTLQTAILL